MHRILHVVGVRWWSAIAAYAVDLADAQRRAGHRVSLAALDGAPAVREARARGLEVTHTFGPDAWEQNHLRRRLAASVREKGVEVLHVHTGVGHLATELARRGHPAALVRTRGEIRAPRATPWNRWLYGRADAITLSASSLRDGIGTLGLAPRDLPVVLGAVDTERFAPGALPGREAVRRRLGLDPAAFVVGIAGRLSPVKGHVHAIRALAHPDAATVHLLVSGEEAQVRRADLAREAQAFGVSGRVHLVDRVRDVREIFAAIDVGLVASVGSEAICRVAAEMMACAMPVIASRISVLPDMITNGTNGVLVPPGDPQALALAMSSLAGSAETRMRLGRSAREAACRELSGDAVASRYDAIYRSAIASRRSARTGEARER